MSEKKETCGNCLHWDARSKYSEFNEGHRVGVCRKNAPMIVGELVESRKTLFTATAWPESFDGDWCGQWEEGRE